MRIKQKETFIVGIATVILFLAGSVLCAMNRWDIAQAIYHPTNIAAIAMAAFLTLSEVCFFWAHSVGMVARSFWRKVPSFLCMIALASTIAWTIGAEWNALNLKHAAKDGAAAVDEVRAKANAEAAGKLKTTLIAKNNESAMKTVSDAFKAVGQEDTLPYRVNFLCALFVLAVLTFTVDRKKKAHWVRKPGQVPQVEPEGGIMARAKRSMGFNSEPVKAEPVQASDLKVIPGDKGMRVYNASNKYIGHISASRWAEVEPQTPDEIVSLLPDSARTRM